MTGDVSGDGGGLFGASPMTPGQLLAVWVAVLLAMLDGFDVLGMAFVAPALSHAWRLDKAVLGFLLSTSLMGMAAGSILLSPLADRVGRKPVVLGGVTLMILGSLASAISHTVPELAAARILTGVGIGVMVPLTTTIASEFASTRSRAFAVAATTVGFTAGSVLGSLIAAALLKHGSWSAVFVSGAVAGAILLPIVMFGLPESPAYLISRRTSGALERLNGVLARLGHPALAGLPEAQARRVSYGELFAPGVRGMLATFAAAMILVSTTTFYLLNWLPQLIADAGFPPSTGALVSATTSLVGIVSGLLFGLAANRFGPARLAGVAMIGLGAGVAVFGLTPPVLRLLLLSSALSGVFSGGCAGLLYATMAASLPPLIRVSGIGLVIGAGRVFSVSGPALAGVMFAAGLSRSSVSLIFACAPVLAGLLMINFVRSRRRSPAGGL